MDLGTFRAEVLLMVARDGTSAIDPSKTGEINKVIQRSLNTWASRTKCLYNAAVPFTPMVGVRSYRTYNPQYEDAVELVGNTLTRVLGVAMCSVSQVVINGFPLTRASDAYYGGGTWPGAPWNQSTNRYGESNQQDVLRSNPGYLTAPNGAPGFWFPTPSEQIEFNCPLDQAYANSFFSGNTYHPVVSLDGDTIWLSPADIEPAQMVARNVLLRPLEQATMGQYIAEVEAVIKARETAAEARTMGYGARGRGRGSRRVGLVN